jgi:hypothetical protein
MLKYIVGSLIVLYIYNTYLAPISRRVQQKRGYGEDQTMKHNNSGPKPKQGDYLEYEEVKDE